MMFENSKEAYLDIHSEDEDAVDKVENIGAEIIDVDTFTRTGMMETHSDQLGSTPECTDCTNWEFSPSWLTLLVDMVDEVYLEQSFRDSWGKLNFWEFSPTWLTHTRRLIIILPVDIMDLVYLEQSVRDSWRKWTNAQEENCNGNLERKWNQIRLKQWKQFVGPSDVCTSEDGRNSQSLCSWVVMVHGKARRYLMKDVFNIHVPEYMNIPVFREPTRTILTEVNSSLLQVRWTVTFPNAVCCNLLPSVQAMTKTDLSEKNCDLLQVQPETRKNFSSEILSGLFQVHRRTRSALIEIYSKMCAYGNWMLLSPGFHCVRAFLFVGTCLWILQSSVFDHSVKREEPLALKCNFKKLSTFVVTSAAVFLMILFINACMTASMSLKFANKMESLSEGNQAMNQRIFDCTENWMLDTVSKHKVYNKSAFSKTKNKWYLNWFPEGIKNISVQYTVCPASAPGPLEHYFTQKFHGLGVSEEDEMKYEWLRLQTFKHWPQWAIPFPSALAKVGFYYTKDGDKVVCFSCSGVVQNWRQNMSPMEIHRSLYPECKFLAGTEENYPIPQSESSAISAVVNEVLSRTPRRPASSIMQSSDSGLPEANSASRVTITTPTSDSYVTQVTSPLDSGFADSRRANGSRIGVGNVVQDSSSRAFGDSQSSLAASEGALSGTFLERMKHEHNRYLTYRTWPAPDINQAKILAKAGFYYSGLEHKVKCAFCDGTLDYSRPDQEPMSYHTRLFPNCPFVRSQNTGNIPSYPVPGSAPPPRPTPVSDLTMLGIMSDSPKHPEFSLLQSRINSFRGWSPEREQKPYDLAVAGFIYAGMSDCVKCFQCDGGLRNWLAGDIPWVEHARWFPQCSHVRLCKGQEFIDSIDELYPRHGNTTTGGAAANPVTAVPRNIDSLLSTPAVQSVLEMGYAKEFVKKGVEMYIQQKGSDSAIDATSLVEILLEIQSIGGDSLMENFNDQNRSAEAKKGDAGGKKQMSREDVHVMDESEIGEELDTKSLREKNRELIEQTLCKICLENKMCITFLPCGHLVSCAECAPALRKCPICRCNIKGRVRVYMS